MILSWNINWLGLVGGEMRKRSKKSFDLVLVIVDGSREGRANAASPPLSVLTWKPYQQHEEMWIRMICRRTLTTLPCLTNRKWAGCSPGQAVRLFSSWTLQPSAEPGTNAWGRYFPTLSHDYTFTLLVICHRNICPPFSHCCSSCPCSASTLWPPTPRYLCLSIQNPQSYV